MPDTVITVSEHLAETVAQWAKLREARDAVMETAQKQEDFDRAESMADEIDDLCGDIASAVAEQLRSTT